ncbi:hypothetical protein HA402_006528 [Bradysia odoriphaga]|nr:hypothetical protein HA402_006528 [Bradysia odoriphaga]
MDQSGHTKDLAELSETFGERCHGKCNRHVHSEEVFQSAELAENSVIDNTNPSKETRRRYIDAAKKLKIQCRCFVMDVPFAHSKHNNIYRELTDSTHKPVNDIVMNTFNKHYEQPTVAEGFEEVVKVNFIPKFNSIDEEQLYRMYLIDS